MTTLANQIVPADGDEESVRWLNELLSKREGRMALIRLIKKEIKENIRREADLTYTKGFPGG